MQTYSIAAMNVENGYIKVLAVRGESYDDAVQRLESDAYISESEPYGWEVVDYEFAQ